MKIPIHEAKRNNNGNVQINKKSKWQVKVEEQLKAINKEIADINKSLRKALA